jgi:cyclopropane fatty-acyl-phospholipid synthase-like methyltransferase
MRLLLTCALLVAPFAAHGQIEYDGLEVPYVPTPNQVVEAMLNLAKVTKDDTVIDLGCGDGRIVITAAQKYGARGIGVDLNPERIAEAEANAKSAKVESRVRFVEQDLFKADIHEASVVTLYLLPSVNARLKPRLLEQLKPGTRIVSHSFDMPDWKPAAKESVDGRTIYLWIIPEKMGR